MEYAAAIKVHSAILFSLHPAVRDISTHLSTSSHQRQELSAVRTIALQGMEN